MLAPSGMIVTKKRLTKRMEAERRFSHFVYSAVILPAAGVLIPIGLLQSTDISGALPELRSDSEYVAEIPASGRPEDCSQLGGDPAVDRCLSQIAVLRKDPAVRNSISNELARDSCYKSLSEMTQSVEPCLQVKDRMTQITCLSPFAAKGVLEQELLRLRAVGSTPQPSKR